MGRLRFALQLGLVSFLVVSSRAALAQEQPPAPQSAVPPVPASVPADATFHSMLMMGNLAGTQASWKTPDGKLHFLFQYNDRGRGPQLFTEMKLAGDVPVSTDTKGNDYFKDQVEEHFSLEKQKANWKNKGEQGEKAVSKPAFYVGMFSPPEELAMLTRAALAQGGRIALLPEGEAGVERVGDLTLTANGKSEKVTQYAISGLDFSPTYIWLDSRKNFFAGGAMWIMVIRKGWESAQQQIVKVQTDADAKRGLNLAKKLAHKPKARLVIYNTNLFDAESASIRKNQTVVVSGQRIESVAPSKESDRSAGEVIDATGRTVIPGVWDMHAHVSGNDGLLNLAAGVTTVRDLANDIDELQARRKRIEEGTEIGTRIIAAGIIDGPGPYQGPTKVLVGTEAEGRAAVQKYAEIGYPQVKLYSSLKPELVPAIIDEAHKRGMRVSGHIPATMTAAECVKLGFNEIQHANFLVLNFMPDVKETRTPARFTEPAKRAVDIDVNSPQVQEFIKLLKERQVAIDPTLSIFENMFADRPGEVGEGFAAVASRMPAQIRRGFLTGGLPVPDGMDQRYRDSFATMLKMVKAAYDAGIPVEGGTDSLAGFALHRELELYVKAGIPAPQVLQLATLGAARIMKRDKELGSIAPGKLADFAIVDGDPSSNISDIRKVRTVIKDGVRYESAELYRELGVATQ
jgi:imidazolonepropionase-like amidohydrolase